MNDTTEEKNGKIIQWRRSQGRQGRTLRLRYLLRSLHWHPPADHHHHHYHHRRCRFQRLRRHQRCHQIKRVRQNWSSGWDVCLVIWLQGIQDLREWLVLGIKRLLNGLSLTGCVISQEACAATVCIVDDVKSGLAGRRKARARLTTWALDLRRDQMRRNNRIRDKLAATITPLHLCNDDDKAARCTADAWGSFIEFISNRYLDKIIYLLPIHLPFPILFYYTTFRLLIYLSYQNFHTTFSPRSDFIFLIRNFCQLQLYF